MCMPQSFFPENRLIHQSLVKCFVFYNELEILGERRLSPLFGSFLKEKAIKNSILLTT